MCSFLHSAWRWNVSEVGFEANERADSMYEESKYDMSI